MIRENSHVDVADLVRDGHLDLAAIFGGDDVRWKMDGIVASYTANLYGADGDRPGDVNVSLLIAEEYGITAYRWVEWDDSGRHEHGPITADRDIATGGACEYARKAGKQYA